MASEPGTGEGRKGSSHRDAPDFSFHDALQRVMEAALRNERALNAAAMQLSDLLRVATASTTSLPAEVAASVRERLRDAALSAARTMSRHFADADAAALRARRAYEDAARRSRRHVATWWLALLSASCAGVTLSAILIKDVILPSPDILRREREAESAVAVLRAQGGDAVLTHCSTSDGDRLCVRTDESGSPNLWSRDGETYRIIHGY